MMAWEINRDIKAGKIITASVPGVGEVRILKARADMGGRVSVQTASDKRFRNVEVESVRILDARDN